MSIKAIDWAFRQKCGTPAEKLVLLALADYANDNGECWPGQDHIAEKTDLVRETVLRLLRSLEKQSLVVSLRKKDASGRDLGKRYFLQFCPPGVTNNHMPCDNYAAGDIVDVTCYKGVEPSVEPSLNQEPQGAREDAFDPQPESPPQDIPVLAEHSWQRFRGRMPLRSGKFLDEESCRTKWVRAPALWNLWLAAVDNYRTSREAQAGAVCSPMTFLSRKWRDWQTPEEPTGQCPPAGATDKSWLDDQRREDAETAEEERRKASGEVMVRPRERLPFEKPEEYQRRLAEGKIAMVPG